MRKQLKVWGGDMFQDGKQVRGLVVAPTRKRALELLTGTSISRYFFDGWWGETANLSELALRANGEGVWVYPDVSPRAGTALTRRIPETQGV